MKQGKLVEPGKPGLEVSSEANLETRESGGQVSFQVSLSACPTAEVVIPVASSNPAEANVSPSALSFGPASCRATQTVTVTGVDDDAKDGNVAYEVLLGPTESRDEAWHGLRGPELSLRNLDDESAGLVVSAASNATTEAGVKATFTVALQARPSVDVVVAVASADAGEGVASPAELHFTPDNWNAPQVVTVTGVDDAEADGRVAYDVTVGPVTSSDADFAALPVAKVALANIDDDSASVIVTAAEDLRTSESGATATFTIVLASRPQPGTEVEIDVASDNPAEGVAAPASLVFTRDNWNAPRTITVTGVDDDAIDGSRSYTVKTSAARSDGVGYDKLEVADVSVVNVDNDSAGFSLVGATGLSTTEAGGTASFGLVLNSRPSADVTIALSSSYLGEGTLSPASLTFTALNWNAPQDVTVSGVDDDLADGAQPYSVVFGAAQSDDPNYAGIDVPNVSLTNVDNDTAGITVSPLSGPSTTEALGSVTFGISLNSRPSADVTIGLTSSDLGEGTVSPASLTFTPANWSSVQTVTVTGVADDVVDGSQTYAIVTAPAVSDDTDYQGLDAEDRLLSNIDGDSAGIVVEPLTGRVVSEAGAQTTFSVVLTSSPSASVTIALSSSNTAEGTVSPASLVFSSANWQTPQTVTVSPVDDAIADGNQVFQIVTAVATSADSAYAGLDAANVSVTNTDNDVAGFTVSPTSGLTTSEVGATATFTVKLNTEPRANVAIAVSSSDLTEGTVAPASLTFTAASWNTAQTVTITGVADALADGNVAYSVVLGAAVSSDSAYNGLDPVNPSVTNNSPDWSTAFDTQATAAYTFSVADINGDSRLDLVTSPGSSQLGYYTQNADHSFTLAQTIAATNDVYGIALGDIDQDSDLDLVTAGPNGVTTSSNMMFTNAAGSFGAGVTTWTSNSVYFYGMKAALADVSNDSKPEALWATTSQLIVGRSPWVSGAWNSIDSISDPASGDAKALEIADVDGDGDRDAVVARGAFSLSWDGGVSIFRNDGTGSLSNHMRIDASTDPIFDHTNPYGLAVADFNGDGKPDLAFSNYSSGLNRIVIALRTSADGAAPSYAFSSVSAGAGELYVAILARDMNGDGAMDLVVGQNTGRILSGDGLGGFTETKNFGSQGYPQVGDFDGNGTLDVAFVRSGTVRIYYWR